MGQPDFQVFVAVPKMLINYDEYNYEATRI